VAKCQNNAYITHQYHTLDCVYMLSRLALSIQIEGSRVCPIKLPLSTWWSL